MKRMDGERKREKYSVVSHMLSPEAGFCQFTSLPVLHTSVLQPIGRLEQYSETVFVYLRLHEHIFVHEGVKYLLCNSICPGLCVRASLNGHSPLTFEMLLKKGESSFTHDTGNRKHKELRTLKVILVLHYPQFDVLKETKKCTTHAHTRLHGYGRT